MRSNRGLGSYERLTRGFAPLSEAVGDFGVRGRRQVRAVVAPRVLVLVALVVVVAHPRGEFPLVGELVRAVGEQRGLPDPVIVPRSKVRAVGHLRRRVQGTSRRFRSTPNAESCRRHRPPSASRRRRARSGGFPDSTGGTDLVPSRARARTACRPDSTNIWISRRPGPAPPCGRSTRSRSSGRQYPHWH